MQPGDRKQLVIALRQAAEELIAHRSIRDLETTLGQIVAAAVDTVPGAVAGGLSIIENGRIRSRAPTGQSVDSLDQLQSELDEGPCITAVVDPPPDGVIYAPDLASPPDSERWPTFAPQAVAHGYRSMLSSQLAIPGDIHAALNLYSHVSRGFDDASRLIAGLFSTQAAILLYGADHAAHLEEAVSTRDLIGQAKGILMERFDVDEDRAFRMLVKSSQDTNIKLADVARWLKNEKGKGK